MAQERPDVDVIVVGGGPVGLAAAIEARLAGLTAVVCEPRSGPIDKACGEGLMPGAVRALERLGVRPTGHPFAGIRYVDDVRSVEHPFRAGPGLGVRRTVLHEALRERAAAVGAAMVQVKVTGFAQEGRRLVVYGTDGRARASTDGGSARTRSGEPDGVGIGLNGRWLLACDGLNSGLRRSLGLPCRSTGVPRYGLRRHFRVRPWSDFVEVHWTPAAELYVTPVADDMVGVAVLGQRGVDFDAALVSAPRVADRLASAENASDLRGAGPLLQRTSRRTAGRVLLVGDASGYVDALTGEGIRVGLAQARAAVAAVVAGDPDQYERAWRHVTRDYRWLTSTLVAAATKPALRGRIVPLASRLPRVYGAIVDRLAA